MQKYRLPSIALSLVLIAVVLLHPINTYASVTVLHTFQGGNDDGAFPFCEDGSPVVSSGVIYGITCGGGDSSAGTIYKVNTDGTGFSLLHEFSGGGSDGSDPSGSLVLEGSILYGVTGRGGDGDNGTVFKINIDGSGFSLLHEFAGDGSDGIGPIGGVALSNSILYGMAEEGGTDGDGVIFKINTNGSGFGVLHSFVESGTDGANPIAMVTVSGSQLFGMTTIGGDNNNGTIFQMNIDGTGFSLIHEFRDTATDGINPYGSLALSGSILYGLTSQGGTANYGTVFKINTDGSSYSTIYEFTAGVNGGNGPAGSLTISGSTMYGTTSQGGATDSGIIFSISTSGTSFEILHEFSGNDGVNPDQSLTISNNVLYGGTTGGGTASKGVLFSYALPALPTDIPESSSVSTTSTSNSSTSPELPQIPLLSSGDNLGGVFTPVVDSNTQGQSVTLIIEPQTFNFNAFVSAQTNTPVTGLGALLVNPITGIAPKKGTKTNAVLAGGERLGIRAPIGIVWQVGNILKIWYKAYPPTGSNMAPAIIIPELQKKPSIVSLSYTYADLIPPGRPKTLFNSRTLKLAYSVDGITWKILPTSAVDTRNKTVAAIHKIGGYYMIVGK